MSKYIAVWGMLISLLGFYPSVAIAAVAFDSSSKLSSPQSWFNATGTTTVALSHTTSGTDRILLVGINDYLAGNGDVVTDVKYAGASMTLINKQARPDDSGLYTYLYYI